jgi:Transposase DDE domain
VDSQSIKTATPATEVGFDGGKQGKGRKRPLLVDTLGLLIAVVGTAANTADRVGFRVLLRGRMAPSGARPSTGPEKRSAPRAGQQLVGAVASCWRPPARSLRGRDRRC